MMQHINILNTVVNVFIYMLFNIIIFNINITLYAIYLMLLPYLILVMLKVR